MEDIIYPDVVKQITLDEHDGVSTPTKKALVYGWDSTNLQKVRLKVDANGQIYVTGTSGSGAILDGVDSNIKATVLDYTNSNPLAVRLTDTDGNYVGAGAGTQYADGAVRGTATGTLAMGDDGTNIQSVAVDTSGHLQIDVLSGGGAGEQYADNTAVNAAYKGNLVLGIDGSNYQIISVTAAGLVNIADGSGSITVDNGGTFAVQAAQSGTWNIGTLTSITNAVPVTDNAGSLTIDFTRLDYTTDDVLIYGSQNVALQQKITTNDLIVTLDGEAVVLGAGSASIGVLGANSGIDIGDVTINNAAGASAVNIQDGGNSITIDGTVGISGTVIVDSELTTADLDTGAGTDTRAVVGLVLAESGGGILVGSANPLPVSDAAGSLTVDASNLDIRDLTSVSDSVTAVQSGTWNIGTVTALTGITNVVHIDDNTSTISIDDGASSITVDGTVTANAGTGNFTVIQSTASSLNAQIVGVIAHDAADSGNYLKIGGRADTTFQTAVADGDRVDALFDVYGQMRVRTDHANLWSYHLNTSSAQTNTQIRAAPGAGLSVYITDIVFSTGAATACNIFFEEGVTTILGPYYLEAIAGRGLALHFQTPKKCTANTAVTYTTSASIAQSIDILGFIAP